MISLISGVPSTANKMFWTGLGTLTTYTLTDLGLSSLFALETLTHGTGPIGYLGIQRNGADPNFGGSDNGSSAGIGSEMFVENSKNYFHVFKDSEFYAPCDMAPSPYKELCEYNLIKPFLPKVHACLSGFANIKQIIPDMPMPLQALLGGAAGLLTPTLKFRFIPEDVICLESRPIPSFSELISDDSSQSPKPCRFENDPDYGTLAYRTRQIIPASHIGLTGAVMEGLKGDLFDRMTKNTNKVFLGIVALAAATITAKLTYNYVSKSFFSPKPQQTTTPTEEVAKTRTWRTVILSTASTITTTAAWGTFATFTLLANTTI